MLDLSKLAQEFVFLRENLKEISSLIGDGNYAKASFLVGTLYTTCHYHHIGISQLVPPPMEAPKAEAAEEVQAEAAKHESAV